MILPSELENSLLTDLPLASPKKQAAATTTADSCGSSKEIRLQARETARPRF